MRRAACFGPVAALLLLAIGWWWSQGADPAPPGATAPGATPVEARTAVDANFARERTALAATAVVGVAPLPGEGNVRSYDITAIVLDEADQPVEGAVVEVRAAGLQRRSPTSNDARDIVWLAATDEVLASAVTDAQGLCGFCLEREFAWVSASHANYGRSIARAIGRHELGSDRRVQLWLLRPVAVRGTVVDSACQPVPYALVQCDDVRPMGKYSPTGWLSANSEGRFEFEVAAGCSGRVSARRGSEASLPVMFVAASAQELLVPFAAAFSIHGCVRDLAGRPVAGASVTLMSSMQLEHTRSGDDGRFAMSVTAAGKCRASCEQPEACRSRAVEFVLSMQDPDPTIDLVLEPIGSIRGQVLTTDGLPAAGLRLSIGGDFDFSFSGKSVETDAGGLFSAPCWPGDKVRISGPGLVSSTVNAGAHGLVLTQQPPPPEMVVTGEVRDAAGQPVPNVTMSWRRMLRPGTVLVDVWSPAAFAAQATIDGSRFSVKSPVLGPDWLLLAIDRNDASRVACAGPFVVGVEHHVVMQLQQPASVDVRVLLAHLPAVAFQVGFSSALSSGMGMIGMEAKARAARTDRDGRVRITDCWPGAGRLVVMRGREVLGTREVDLRSGENGEILIDIEQ